MELPIALTMEQQFKLRVYQNQAQALSQEEAQEFLVELLRQLMVKDNLLKHLIKGG